jgi:hypothetical protein
MKVIQFILKKNDLDQKFPDQDQQEIDRITFFKNSGDLVDFKIIDSDDNSTRTISYIFNESEDKKKVLKDPTLVAIREELEAKCYERDIQFTKIY